MSGSPQPPVPPISSPHATFPGAWYLSYEIPTPNTIVGRTPTREEVEVRIHPGASNFQLANMRSTLYQPPPPREPAVEETPAPLPPLNFPRRIVVEPRTSLTRARASNAQNNSNSRPDDTRRPPPLRAIVAQGDWSPFEPSRAAGNSQQHPSISEGETNISNARPSERLRTSDEIGEGARQSFFDHLFGRTQAAADGGLENPRNVRYPGLESYTGLSVTEESFLPSTPFERPPPIMRQRRSQGLEIENYLGLGGGPEVTPRRRDWSGLNIPLRQPPSEEQQADDEDEFANYIYPLIDGVLVAFELENVLTSLQMATLLADPDLENRSVGADLVHPFTAAEVPHIQEYRYRLLGGGTLGLRQPVAIRDRITRSRAAAAVRDQGVLALMNPRYFLHQPQELTASQETQTVSGSDFYQSDYAVTQRKKDWDWCL
ncbi:hypothetical protein IFR05_010660 [Cadophora sp. M221]|nr:hypothetical protein IFR05_010660 [Cadophora sp. M221]